MEISVSANALFVRKIILELKSVKETKVLLKILNSVAFSRYPMDQSLFQSVVFLKSRQKLKNWKF